MTALPHLGIGIGAPGLGALPPSPGCTALVTVTTTRTFPGDEHTDTHTYTWHGFTAKEAMRHRIERLREAGRGYSRDGSTITTATDRGEWLETTTYQYADGGA